MDVAYNQHAARRKNRSSTNLNHLTLAPLTSKLPPLQTADDDNNDGPLFDPTLARTTSYLAGKSAPTTPRLLSRSPGPSRSNSRPRGTSVPGGARLPKSKSATHLVDATAPTTPGHHHHHHRRSGSGHHAASLNTSPTNIRRRGHGHDGRSDSDWLLRVGALISTETRESKGQAWLVSRASSTSLAGVNDAETEAFERELARERELASRTGSRAGSRRGSVHDSDYHHHHHGYSHGSGAYSQHHSPTHSRLPSRSQSRVGSRSQLLTPSERRSIDGGGGYFSMTSPTAIIGEGDDDVSSIAGPDFVNLDEQLEAAGFGDGAGGEDEFLDAVAAGSLDDDEAAVRRLVKRGNLGGWLGNLVGVQLFAVREDEEEDDEDDDDGTDDDEDADDDDETETEEEGDLLSSPSELSSVTIRREKRFEHITTTALVDLDERMPPPKEDQGGWHDAAWLLTVASKVLL